MINLTANVYLLKMAARLASDHRLIGKAQKLFFFNESSEGSCFFLPKGAYIYNKLIGFLRNEYQKRNYQEIISPTIFSTDLWKKSGHWEHYENNMIHCKASKYPYCLKPMNCPGHCVVYQNIGKILEGELPLRLAEFGVLHRNELSGTLLGLKRVRRFTQDDAHIFCSMEQIEEEITQCIDFTRDVYKLFGLKFNFELSLRPKNFIGLLSIWDKAEDSLRAALANSKCDWTENKYDGAFYGPKIDVMVQDNNEKYHQCATIQLDFQLPERFDLYYSYKGGKKRPVIIHRAILGSIERFIAMLCENQDGLWPFWLSPIQAQLIPIVTKYDDYATSIKSILNNEGFMVDIDTDPSLTFNRKIRNAQIERYNFTLVVGKKEMESRTVCVRVNLQDNTHQVTVSIDKLVEMFKKLETSQTLNSRLDFMSFI